MLYMIVSRKVVFCALAKDTIPDEIFAVKGKEATEATMHKVLLADLAQTIHQHFAVCRIDTHNCYD